MSPVWEGRALCPLTSNLAGASWPHGTPRSWGMVVPAVRTESTWPGWVPAVETGPDPGEHPSGLLKGPCSPNLHPPTGWLQPVRITGSSDVDAELTTHAEQRPQPRHPDAFTAQVPAGEPLTGGQGGLSPPSGSWQCKGLEPADSDTGGA